MFLLRNNTSCYSVYVMHYTVFVLCILCMIETGFKCLSQSFFLSGVEDAGVIVLVNGLLRLRSGDLLSAGGGD